MGWGVSGRHRARRGPGGWGAPSPIPTGAAEAPGHGQEWDLCVKKAWGGVGTEGRRGNGGTATAGSICHGQVMYRRWELRAKRELVNMLKWLLETPLPSTLAHIYARVAFSTCAGINPNSDVLQHSTGQLSPLFPQSIPQTFHRHRKLHSCDTFFFFFLNRIASKPTEIIPFPSV